MVSPDLEAEVTAAKEANGSAPAGDSPTSSAAHAAAILPRIDALRGETPLFRPLVAESGTPCKRKVRDTVVKAARRAEDAAVDDRIRRWDERYARGEELHAFAPSPPLAEAVEGVAPGLALDLACGAGRHALFLAGRGWKVQALDGSRAGLDRLAEEALRRGTAGIEARAVDLEADGFTLPLAAFDLVCDFYFLHRPLFAQIHRAVKPGGRFAAAIHVRTQPDEKNRFLLEPGELRNLVLSWDWKILHYREGVGSETGHHHHGTAELIALRPL